MSVYVCIYHVCMCAVFEWGWCAVGLCSPCLWWLGRLCRRRCAAGGRARAVLEWAGVGRCLSGVNISSAYLLTSFSSSFSSESAITFDLLRLAVGYIDTYKHTQVPYMCVYICNVCMCAFVYADKQITLPSSTPPPPPSQPPSTRSCSASPYTCKIHMSVYVCIYM